MFRAFKDFPTVPHAWVSIVQVSHLLLFCLVVILPPMYATADERPNILFAFGDDWGRHASAYVASDGNGTENDLIHTPNFDAIAKSGVLFNNAFVNAPSCTPCRSSLLSGQQFWRTRTGAILRGAVWDDTIPSWPLLLKDNGYHIGFTWKVWSPGTPLNAPFGGESNSYSPAGNSFNQFSQSVTKLLEQGKTVDEAKEVLADQVRANFRAMLAARKPNRPFAYWFGPTNAHRKWVAGSGEAIWGINPHELKGKMPPFLPDVPEIRQDLADYLGEAQAFDFALGILVDELKLTGEFAQTIMAVSGDHGPAGFPHGKCNLYDFGTRVALAVSGPGISGGRVVDDFVSLPDLAPTFLEAGKTEIPDVMTAISIWPVLNSQLSGLVDNSRSQVYIGRERHVAEARAGNLPYPQRAIRTKDHLFIINFRPDRYPLGDHYGLGSADGPSVIALTNNTRATLPDEDAGPTKAWIVSNRREPDVEQFFDHAYGKRPREELYDLNTDPHQMENVADEPAYSEIVDSLREQLMNELHHTGDPRLVDDGKFFETPPMAGPAVERTKKRKRKRQK